MKTATIVQTARDTGDRLAVKGVFPAAPKCAGQTALTLKKEERYQRIIGFGGAFTEAAAYTFSRLKPALQNDILKRYFDPMEGLGYTIGRVHINSCDFSLENYTYVQEGDAALDTFDLSREEKWTIPFITAAVAAKGSGINLLASPWSPPAWMKTNGDMNNGGKLLPEYAGAWARYMARYIKEMRARGLDIWAVTVQNETEATQTWDSCRYSAMEEADFVKNHLGPVLEREGLGDVHIYIVDHNRDILFERTKVSLSDPEAAKYIYGVADHWYVSEDFGALTKVHEMFPDKHLLYTEGCQEGGVHLGSWQTGERYGRNIIGDFSNWQEGWIDWNLVLDEEGGPNHKHNFCDALIIADTQKQQLIYNSSFYYTGQFSRYVKPGAVRIGVEAQGDTALSHLAFLNEDGSTVLVVMNETDFPEAFQAGEGDDYVSHTLVPHAIATLVFA